MPRQESDADGREDGGGKHATFLHGLVMYLPLRPRRKTRYRAFQTTTEPITVYLSN
jgi:hypothetical protein